MSTRTRTRLLSVGGLTLAAASALTAVATGAEASTTSGYCEKGRYHASFSLAYHTRGSYDYGDWFRWNLGGRPMGNRNNVEARVKSVNSGGTGDHMHFRWVSLDNVKPGHDERPIPEYIKVKRRASMYAAFAFVFDKPGAGDPKCTGRTRSV